MKAKVLRGFPFSKNGIDRVFIHEGTVAVFSDERQAEALEAEGYIENVEKKPKPILTIKNR